MAKCAVCNSCLRVIRNDMHDENDPAYFCPFCKKNFSLIKKEEIIDSTRLTNAIRNYVKLYGNFIN